MEVWVLEVLLAFPGNENPRLDISAIVWRGPTAAACWKWAAEDYFPRAKLWRERNGRRPMFLYQCRPQEPRDPPPDSLDSRFPLSEKPVDRR